MQVPLGSYLDRADRRRSPLTIDTTMAYFGLQ